MPRPKPEDISSAGQDSFLDVVTNIVGILIILVMVVGARVQKISLDAASQAPPAADHGALETEVEEREHTLTSAESEIQDLQAQTQMVQAAIDGASSARLQLATAVSAGVLVVGGVMLVTGLIVD